MRGRPREPYAGPVVTLRDRLAASLVSLMFSAPASLLIFIAANRLSPAPGLSPALFYWAVAACVGLGLLFPHLVIEVRDVVWKAALNLLPWW